MQTYGSLNLRKLRDDNGLDFAHFTFLKNQCSCCYGPQDLPDRYWVKGRKPKLVKKNGYDVYEPRLGEVQYILFKNADNGSGYVTGNDVICQLPKHCDKYSRIFRPRLCNTYICWQFPEEKMDGVLRSLREQLDDDYVVLRPKNKLSCICIVLKENLQEKDKEFIFE